MGWMTLSQAPASERREIDAIAAPHEVVRASKVGSVWYVAARRNGIISALIILTSRNRDGSWSYKDLSEDMDPTAADAPPAILDCLSPTTDEYAINWRDQCWLNYENKQAINKLRYGQVIKVKTPITFGGKACDTFTVATYRTKSGNERRCFHAAGVGLVRLSPHHLIGMEIIHEPS